jgi:hypothetical protein
MPFVDDFYNTLHAYNETFWPITIITFLLGVIAVYLAARKSKSSGKLISFILSFLWSWSGIIFFILSYGPMDVEFLGLTMPGVWYLGGVLFLIQGLLFLIFGWLKSCLSFEFAGDGFSLVGTMMVIYAVAVYPTIGFLTGYGYPRYPLFGTAPCPLTIFTLGFLHWGDRKLPLTILIIPFVWSLTGIMPIIVLDVWADIGELISGIIGFPLILLHNSKLRH